MRKSAVLLALMLFLGIVPRLAWAQPAEPTNPAAEDDKRHGDEAMVALRYAEALVYYSRAYEANHSTALLYNMGRAYEGLGDFPKALEALEGFADKASPELKARVPKLEELLTDVRKRVSTLIVSSNVDGAEIRLGDRVVGKTKNGQQVLRVLAGPKKLSVSADGYFNVEKDVMLPASQIETVEARLLSRTEGAVLHVTSVTGALVFVDGKKIGVVPAETPTKPGTHKLTLTLDGYNTAETSVVVTAGQRKDVEVPMSVHETVTQKWWFWTAIGVAVVAGGIATYVVATTEKDADHGTIAPGQVKAQGFRF